jgi:hypothetical protein
MSDAGNIPAAVRSQDSARAYKSAKTQVAAARPSLENHLNAEENMGAESHIADGAQQQERDAPHKRYVTQNGIQHQPDEDQGGIVDVTV